MREERALVQLEIGRPDHGDAGSPDRGGVLGELNGGCSRLRPRVHDHVERALDEELGHALPLVDAEQDPFPGRAEREQPVQPTRAQEVDQWLEALLVEDGAAVLQRSGRRCERSPLHAATLCWRPCRDSAPSATAPSTA